MSPIVRYFIKSSLVVPGCSEGVSRIVSGVGSIYGAIVSPGVMQGAHNWIVGGKCGFTPS